MRRVLVSGAVLAGVASLAASAPLAVADDVPAVDAPPQKISIRGTIRDFRGYDLPAQGSLPRGHIDFENSGGSESGIVESRLGPDGLPVYAKEGKPSATTHGRAAFDQWYRDTPNVNLASPLTIGLTLQDDGRYAFKLPSFFPLDHGGFVARGEEPGRDDGTGTLRNFSFTTELHSDITYTSKDQRIDVLGDDDIWVFVDGRLALDLGGAHSPLAGTVRLDGQALDLTLGRTYALDIFQAERHTSGSSYQLTVPRLGIVPGQPSIPTAAAVGDSIGCKPGAWPEGIALGYAWYRGETPIEGATSADYRVVDADAGRRLTCRVTGTGPRTSTAADSDGVVVPVPPKPDPPVDPPVTPDPPVVTAPVTPPVVAAPPVVAPPPTPSEESRYRCLGRKRFTIQLRDGKRRALRSASVVVGGARTTTRRQGRTAFTAVVDLRRGAAGLYTVKTRVVTRSGVVTRNTTRYRVCASR